MSYFNPPDPSLEKIYRKTSMSKVLDDKLVEIDEIIAGLEAGNYGIVSSPGGCGKSFVMLLAAVQMAVGLPILNGLLGPAKRGGQRVIYISSEDNPETRVTNRLIQICRELQIRRCNGLPDSQAALLERNLSVIEADTFERGVKGGLDFDKDNPPRLIIVDTYRTFATTVDENSNAENSVFTSYLADYARSYGAAFLIVHHTNKQALSSHAKSESTAGQERGAACLRDNARSAITVWPMNPDEKLRYIVEDPDRIVIVRGGSKNHERGGSEQWFQKNDYGVPVAIETPLLANTPVKSGKSRKQPPADKAPNHFFSGLTGRPCA